MAAASRVGFFKSGFTLVVLKGAGIRPEVRKELIRVVRNDKMLCALSWRREEGTGSRELVLAWLDVTSVSISEERGLNQVKPSEVRVEGGAFCKDYAGVTWFHHHQIPIIDLV